MISFRFCSVLRKAPQMFTNWVKMCVMCVLCFNICVPFVCFSFLETGHVGSYQWGESLPQRHRLHPSGKTAQPTCSESTCKYLNPSDAQLMALSNEPLCCCWWCSLELLCGICTCPWATWTCKHNNAERWSVSLWVWSPLCIGGRRALELFSDWCINTGGS